MQEFRADRLIRSIWKIFEEGMKQAMGYACTDTNESEKALNL